MPRHIELTDSKLNPILLSYLVTQIVIFMLFEYVLPCQESLEVPPPSGDD